MRKHDLEYFKLTPELELMFELAAGKTVESYPEGINWDVFEKQVYKNRMDTLIAPALKNLPMADEKQRDVFAQIGEAANQQVLLCMKQCQALAVIAADFEKNGIRLICLKGPMLAIELYQNPALRYSRDLDLLVSEEDLDRACARLLQMGFQKKHKAVEKTRKRRKAHKNEEMHAVFVCEDVCVELHWRISLRWEASFPELWKQRQRQFLFGYPVYCLGKMDNLSYLICHGAAHGYVRLRWLLDLYFLLLRSETDYVSLYRAMTAKKTQVLLLETLLFLYRCRCFQMPAVENELFGFRQGERLVHIQYREKIGSSYKKAAKMLDMIWPFLLLGTEEWGITGKKYRSALPGKGQRHGNLGFLLSLIEPTAADFEHFDFPDGLYFLYYIVCPVFKLRRGILKERKKNGG